MSVTVTQKTHNASANGLRALPGYKWGMYVECIDGDEASMIMALEKRIFVSTANSHYLAAKVMPRMETTPQMNRILASIRACEAETEALQACLDAIK